MSPLLPVLLLQAAAALFEPSPEMRAWDRDHKAELWSDTIIHMHRSYEGVCGRADREARVQVAMARLGRLEAALDKQIALEDLRRAYAGAQSGITVRHVVPCSQGGSDHEIAEFERLTIRLKLALEGS